MPSYKNHKSFKWAAVKLIAFKDVHKHMHTALPIDRLRGWKDIRTRWIIPSIRFE